MRANGNRPACRWRVKVISVAVRRSSASACASGVAADAISGILYSAGIRPSADDAWMRVTAALVRALTTPRSNHTGW